MIFNWKEMMDLKKKCTTGTNIEKKNTKHTTHHQSSHGFESQHLARQTKKGKIIGRNKELGNHGR
jgi:hypothetical protein